MTDEQKQQYIEAQKEYRTNMTDEQKQKYKYYPKDYQNEYRKNYKITDEQKKI